MRVGIIAGAMKPCTRGHWELIQRASRENDRVVLFVSTADRGGMQGEALIRGSDMVEVWERFLVIHLPANVKLEFVKMPIRSVYEMLGDADKRRSIDEFSVYSDPRDVEVRFGLEKQRKYFGDLLEHGQVKFISVERTGEMDVSATQMRRLFEDGMRDAFISLLPTVVDGMGIWEYLQLKKFLREEHGQEAQEAIKKR